jgi:hypothetical protein
LYGNARFGTAFFSKKSRLGTARFVAVWPGMAWFLFQKQYGMVRQYKVGLLVICFKFKE